MSYTNIITEVGNLFASHGRTIFAAAMAVLITALIVVALITALAILRETPKAIRETKARQKEWHPDPEAERLYVEYHFTHDRRQAIIEAQARRDSRRLARVAEAQE